MGGSTRLLAGSCWLSKHTGRILLCALPVPRQLWLCRLPTALPMQCPCCSKGVRAHVPEAPSTHQFLRRGKEKKSYPAPWGSEQKVVEGSQTARASPAAPFLLTPFPVGSMHYCFLLSHLQHPDRKKDFSPCFADCRGHRLLPGGWSCAGKGHPIQARGSALPLCQGQGGVVGVVPPQPPAAPSSMPEQLHQHFQNSPLLKNKEPHGCPGCWNHQQGQGRPGPMSPVDLSQNYSGQLSTNTRANSSTFPVLSLFAPNSSGSFWHAAHLQRHHLMSLFAFHC